MWTKRHRISGTGWQVSGSVEPLFPEFDGDLAFDSTIVRPSLDFIKFLHTTKQTPQQLLELDSRQFEELVAEIWHRFGYEVELTARTRDGGRDIVAVRKCEASLRFLIECKRYRPTHKVGIEVVRSLYGVKIHDQATKAILATTSYFTSPAKEFFRQHQWELEPRDYDGIVDWVKKVGE